MLRANKSTMAWGIEVRTPLLSQAVCDYAMNTDPAQKMIDVSAKDEDGPGVHKILAFTTVLVQNALLKRPRHPIQ